MILFLFGIVFGWLIGLTCFQFRREVPVKDPSPVTWTGHLTYPKTTVAHTTDFGKAEFIENDRVSEIIKGKKEDVRLDDILV